MVHLNIEERFLYLDPMMMKMLLPLMIGDHCSYKPIWNKRNEEESTEEIVFANYYMTNEWLALWDSVMKPLTRNTEARMNRIEDKLKYRDFKKEEMVYIGMDKIMENGKD